MSAEAMEIIQHPKPTISEIEIRAALAAMGIQLPVRIEYDRPIVEVGEVQQLSATMFFDRIDGKPHFAKVAGKAIRCSCRGKNCAMVRKVRALVRPGDYPYSNARRRPAPTILYPCVGPPERCWTEATRRRHAYLVMESRSMELAMQLCLRLHDPPVHRRQRRPRIPLAHRAYMLLARANLRLTDAQLIQWLRTDAGAIRLGIRKSPCVNTLVRIAKDRRILAAFRRALRLTVAPVRKIETVGCIDQSGRPTIMVANYLESKWGHYKSRIKRNKTKIAEHLVVGRLTGIVAAFNVTMDYGRGSADAVHLRPLLRAACGGLTSLEVLVGDQAYGSQGNGRACQRAGVQLATAAKMNEERSGPGWPFSLSEMAIFEQEFPVEFEEIMGPRSRAETAPSRSKRRNPFYRRRRRKTDVLAPVPVEKTDSEETICNLPDRDLFRLVRRAERAVGVARSIEAAAIQIMDNMRALVMLEHLYDDKVNFEANHAFEPMRTIRQCDLVTAA